MAAAFIAAPSPFSNHIGDNWLAAVGRPIFNKPADMKKPFIVTILILCAHFSAGCMTATFATSKTEFISNRYIPGSIFKNTSKDFILSGLPLERPQDICYFHFESETSQRLVSQFPAGFDSRDAANFIKDNKSEIFFSGHKSAYLPDGYFEMLRLDATVFEDGVFEGDGHDKNTGYARLNMIWTIPIDLATAPIQIIWLYYLKSIGFQG
jgi:hypothetical protein